MKSLELNWIASYFQIGKDERWFGIRDVAEPLIRLLSRCEDDEVIHDHAIITRLIRTVSHSARRVRNAHRKHKSSHDCVEGSSPACLNKRLSYNALQLSALETFFSPLKLSENGFFKMEKTCVQRPREPRNINDTNKISRWINIENCSAIEPLSSTVCETKRPLPHTLSEWIFSWGSWFFFSLNFCFYVLAKRTRSLARISPLVARLVTRVGSDRRGDRWAIVNYTHEIASALEFLSGLFRQQ